ncbi:MAG: hypothetical protein IJU64_07125 [Bacilli bacterium]|nr:hypothetical protein [Bacilli bacterium]
MATPTSAGTAVSGKLSVSGPTDSATAFDALTFTVSMAESDLTSGKANLILSAIKDKDPSGKEFYSQTNTLASPIAHTKQANETYYRVYEISISTNYDTLKAADSHGELDTKIGALTETYTLVFSNLAITGGDLGENEINQAPTFAVLNLAKTAIDTDDEVAAEFGGSHVVASATISIACNTVSDSNKAWTYYLVTYMDGTANEGAHTAGKTYVGKVSGAHSVE